MDMERTLIILKPDAVGRRLVGPILTRFERKGLRIVGMKMQVIGEEQAKEHYAEHKDKPIFPGLIGFITKGPVIVMALEGPQAISVCRNLIGGTDPAKAAAGTIRGDFGLWVRKNLVHGSDSPASAAREIDIFFKPEELLPPLRELHPAAGEDFKWIYYYADDE